MVAPTNGCVSTGVLYAGVDVILDIVGAPYLNRNVEALAVGGRLFIIGLQEGATGDINLSPFLGKQLTVAGTSIHPSCLPWLQCYATFLFK
jgi:NADPH:quinone reductase-like Zn-dependent oxidoreductase